MGTFGKMAYGRAFLLFLVALAGIGGGAEVARAEMDAAPKSGVCGRDMASFQQMALDSSTRLAFSNRGGMFGGGVCWWHSRLQRAAIYLTEFKPDLPKPSRAQAAWMISALSSMKRVVVIPGYSDFKSFSADFSDLIQARLQAWQREDGILRFRWIDGLTGHTSVSASSLQYIMGRIHDMVAVQHRIVFEKLQVPGVAAHAWLIIGSQQTADGYILQVIDSNEPDQTLNVQYHFGDQSLFHPWSSTPFVPYLLFEKDLSRIYGTLQGYCG